MHRVLAALAPLVSLTGAGGSVFGGRAAPEPEHRVVVPVTGEAGAP